MDGYIDYPEHASYMIKFYGFSNCFLQLMEYPDNHLLCHHVHRLSPFSNVGLGLLATCSPFYGNIFLFLDRFYYTELLLQAGIELFPISHQICWEFILTLWENYSMDSNWCYSCYILYFSTGISCMPVDNKVIHGWHM